MDEQDEDPYNVPPSSPHQANYVARHLPHKLDEEAPPKLKPKKGTNSFRISFAALDSKALPSTPKPAPRRLSHKESSVDSQPDEPVGEEQHISSKGEASFDLISCNTAECLETSQTKSSPQEEMEEKTTSVALPDNTVTSSSDSMDTTLLNVMGDSSKSSVARPKPKPRMRIPKVSSNSDKNNTMGKQESEQISIAAPEIALQVNNVNDDGINADGQQCRYFNIPFNIPPDADSLESVFNKELEDKYGFENTFWNNDTTSTPLSCIEGSNLSKENDPYDSDDDYSRTLAEEDGVEDFGNKKPQVKDSSQSLPPSTEVGVDSAAAFISKDTTSEKLQALFPLPLDPSPNSSSFDIGNKDISERKLNFEDLQDLDPLMQNKTDKIDEKRNEKDNPWEFQYSMATTDISSESNSLYSEATTFIDTEKVGETNQSISDIVSKAFEILPELESSGWQEPLAPPPPLPDEAKIISPHVPPPIPPRPDLPNRPDKLILTSSNEDKAALQGNELIDQALREDEVSSSSIFDELPTPQFSFKPDNGDPFQGSEFGDDCIEFNTKTEQSASPSALSLSSQSLPTPPSPSTKPKPLSRSSVQGAVPPSDDPERISRFVPPPPGAKFRRNDANLEYDLALEGESDSDDEDEVPPSFRQSDERDMPQAMDPRRSLLTMEPHSGSAPWPDGGPESLRSPCCGLAIYKNSLLTLNKTDSISEGGCCLLSLFKAHVRINSQKIKSHQKINGTI
ncbi:hypothetical protein PoB_000862700 [Plakobranchus ocellatus]|uniref:Uncharacterized protein n=1 Tax=Plakobranchus ocellatus TaxID=259542 RepID=A0AAV3YIC4_9GAST|nr:hypothetical protein PoB_000862700 [Plakobranchus ocellatus]